MGELIVYKVPRGAGLQETCNTSVERCVEQEGVTRHGEELEDVRGRDQRLGIVTPTQGIMPLKRGDYIRTSD